MADGRLWTGAVAGAAAIASFSAAAVAEQPGCPRADALGVSRTVEIDTTGAPGFGMQHYKAYDFLQPKEVVLTFDDGPQKFSTEMVLAALAEQCVKATFFSIGKMALGYPEIIREVAKAGHTIGTHTWSHQSFPKLNFEGWKDEMERGVSGVKRAVGGPIAPFFRYPTLKDSPESITYLGTRNISMFSTDIDSFDFKIQSTESLAKSVLDKLDKAGKGIVLMHDIHKHTAKAVPAILKGLKERGFKIVHMTAKREVETVPEFDALIEKDTKGLPQAGAERPTTSVVRTIEGEPTAEETAKPEPPAQKPAAPSPQTAAPPAKPEAQAAATPASTPAAPAANPVTTTTSSISKADGAPATEDAAGPSKGLSERASEVWQQWFGK